ncbi:hypothetical protein AVEN_144371-1, partial [Araneus ventricosus]
MTSPGTRRPIYADDTAIMSTGISQLEISDNLNNYLAEL